jgi:hypothetical protein
MKRTVAQVLYWPAAVVITLGAFGHGFVGVGAYVYSRRDPFWLMFIVLGVLAIGTTWVLGAPRKPAT